VSADALNWLCTHLTRLRVRALSRGLGDQVEALVSTVLEGGDVSLGEIVALSRVLSGPEPTLRDIPALPGLEGRPAELVYVCPQNRCTRVQRREPGGSLPMCQLRGEPMRAMASSS
jgi:hypothetical protein